jgi:hypothetical protein
MKTATITEITFTSEWKAPDGRVVMYHEVTFDNGDTGILGSITKYPDSAKKGTQVEYELNGKKIKINNGFIPPAQYAQQQGNSVTGYTNKTKKVYTQKQDAFLGYAWSYAKDLIIAGKSMDDVEELNKVARYIYSEIGKMLVVQE